MDGVTVKQDWQRLAERVRERRLDLDVTQEDVRSAGGPSTATQRLIEGGLQYRYQPVVLRRLEHALRWQRGSVRAVLAGGEPVPVTGPPAAAPAGPPQPPAGAAPASPRLALAAAVLEDELARSETEVWAETGLDPQRYAAYEGPVAGVTFAHPAEAALLGMELTPLGQRVRWIAEFRVVRARSRGAAPESRRAG